MSDITTDQQLLAAAMNRLEKLNRAEAFDPTIPESRPTAKQQEVFNDFGKIHFQYIRAGNQSGKSQVCGKIVSQVATETHPTWKRPSKWGSEPLLIIVAAASGKHIEDTLFPKIASYLEEGTYKVVRVGNMIQRLEIDNGNRIIFQSLENTNEAQKRLQSYVAHLVWIDELPPTMGILRELQVRIQARNGYLLASFTPTRVNAEIRHYLDNLNDPRSRIYRFHMLDNPLYADLERKAQLISQYSHLPADQQRMVFEGEWLGIENQVYYFNWDTMVEFPQGYSPMWRHVEAVDPALKSALGLTVWAENPETYIWYCIMAEYVKGIYVPTDIVANVTARTKHMNIVKRIADPEATWYITTAQRMGFNYINARKHNRKSELIKQLQQGLGPRFRLSPEVHDLISELQGCRWSESDADRIVNSSSYHLLDSAQYFADEIPKPESKIVFHSFDDYLYKANEKRKLMRDKVRDKVIAKATRVARRSKRWT